MYARILSATEDVLTQLRGWAEDCSCHSWLISRRLTTGPSLLVDPPSKSVCHKRWQRLVEGEVASKACPCLGLRASNFAAGDAHEVFDNISSVTAAEMVLMALKKS